MRRIRLVLIMVLLSAGSLTADELTYRDELSRLLVAKAPEILRGFDPATGHFGQGIWIVTDQNDMFALAAAYSLDIADNPYHKDAKLLEVIVKAGDALIADADARGQWVFRKKDGSTWGKISMPWTYSRWVRAFALIRDDMPADRREAWTKALTLGYEGIAANLNKVHNIPTHHAMGLYIAGKAMDRPEWCTQAAEFMHKVVDEQSSAGYWSEGEGPVVNYNFVYLDAIGTYYALSHDEAVLPALTKASLFHRHFTYPGGQSVETIDQRNPYHDTIAAGNVGFTFTPAGRAFLQTQWQRLGGMKDLKLDLVASLILYGQEGPIEDEPAAGRERVFTLTEDGVERAATLRKGPWFVCLSAYTAPINPSRWLQDRQNFVSIWHDKVGLIAGGGNTKLQPAWSTFTVGDVSLLRHKPADTQPDFSPKGELYHVPSAATLLREPLPGLDLTYGPAACRLRVRIEDDRTLTCTFAAETDTALPTAAHLTLLPHVGKLLTTGNGRTLTLGDEPIELSPADLGGTITYAGVKLDLPADASLHWPALPHNPYVRDGSPKSTEEGRIEIRLPLDKPPRQQQVILHVE